MIRSDLEERNCWEILGALVVLAAALVSLYYALATGQASVLAFYLISLFVGSALTLAMIGTGDDHARQLYFLFLIVYSINVILVLAFAYVLTESNGLPFVSAPEGVIPDDERFYAYGAVIAEAWRTGGDPSLPLGIKFHGYPYFLGLCIYVSSFFGDMSPISPRFLNAMAGALLAVTVFRIANLTFENKQISRTATLLTAAFPVFSYYSAILFRDILIAYLIALAVLLFLEMLRRDAVPQRLLCLGILSIVVGAVFLMRDLSAVVLLAGFAAYLFFTQGKWLKFVMVAVGIIAVIQVAAMLDLDAPKVQMYLTYVQRASDVFARIESQDSLGMRYIIGAPFPFNFVLRFPYAALVPIPPIIAVDLLSIVRGSGALIWYFLFPFWIYGM